MTFCNSDVSRRGIPGRGLRGAAPSILRSRGLPQPGRSAAGWRTPSPASPHARLTAAKKWRFLARFRKGPLPISFAKHDLGPRPATIAPSVVTGATLTWSLLIT